jgi:hypothetical protein
MLYNTVVQQLLLLFLAIFICVKYGERMQHFKLILHLKRDVEISNRTIENNSHTDSIPC